MITSISQARDEMFAMLYQAVRADATYSATPIEFQGKENEKPMPNNSHYMRITVNHVIGDQATLAGANGKRRYDREGNIIVQSFAPISAPDRLKICEELATIAQLAYQGKQSESCIWFRNVRINEIGNDNRGFYQFNTNADFIYDQIS